MLYFAIMRSFPARSLITSGITKDQALNSMIELAEESGYNFEPDKIGFYVGERCEGTVLTHYTIEV